MRAVFTALLLSVASACHAHVRVEPKSELEFVYLPGGTFHYGCEPQDTQCAGDEQPGKTVTVQPFWLGKTTVTVASYSKCVSAGACTEPSTGIGYCNWSLRGKENHPVNCIDWNQATAFCGWIGGRLPTAEEWEYAAKGGESRIYPWGDEAPDANRALFGKTYPAETAPAESYAGGASKHGLQNMVGNVFQWTASELDAAKRQGAFSDPSPQKEIRGGTWADPPPHLRASSRWGFPPLSRASTFGVRCALSLSMSSG